MSLLRSVIASSKTQKPMSKVNTGSVAKTVNVTGTEKPVFSDGRQKVTQTTDLSSIQPVKISHSSHHDITNVPTTTHHVADSLIIPITSSLNVQNPVENSKKHAEHSKNIYAPASNTSVDTTDINLHHALKNHDIERTTEQSIESNNPLFQQATHDMDSDDLDENQNKVQQDTLSHPSISASSVESVDASGKLNEPSEIAGHVPDHSETPDINSLSPSLKIEPANNDASKNNDELQAAKVELGDISVPDKTPENVEKYEAAPDEISVGHSPNEKAAQTVLLDINDVREKLLVKSRDVQEKSEVISPEIVIKQAQQATENIVQSEPIQKIEQTNPSLPSQAATTISNHHNNYNFSTPARAQTSSKSQNMPRVHIGQIDVIIQAPQTVAKQPAASRAPSDFASRMYLRRL